MKSFWIRNNKFVRFTIPLILSFIPFLILLNSPENYYDGTHQQTTAEIKYLVDTVRVNNYLIRFYLVILLAVAILYVFYYFFEQKKPPKIVTYYGDSGYKDFCRLKRDIIKSMDGKLLNDPIFATSHCNLFANIDCVVSENHQEIMDINAKYLKNASKLIDVDNQNAKYILLLYHQDNEDGRNKLKIEVQKRETILKEQNININIERKFKKFLFTNDILTDYLVIEDHVFITMRAPKDSQESVTCLYIKETSTAETHRIWIKHLIESVNGSIL